MTWICKACEFKNVFWQNHCEWCGAPVGCGP